MHLALVCFFFEADAAELALKAGREARQLYQAEHALEPAPYQRGACLSLRERLEDTLLLIAKLVDPIRITKVVRRLEGRVYTLGYKKTWNGKGGNEANFFS